MDDRPADEPDLLSSESERLRRRDRQRTAKDRELMRTGQAKAFKQILDAQARRAAETRTPRGSGRGRRAPVTPDRTEPDDGADRRPPSR